MINPTSLIETNIQSSNDWFNNFIFDTYSPHTTHHIFWSFYLQYFVFDNFMFDNFVFDNFIFDNFFFDNFTFDNFTFNNFVFDNFIFDNFVFDNFFLDNFFYWYFCLWYFCLWYLQPNISRPIISFLPMVSKSITWVKHCCTKPLRLSLSLSMLLSSLVTFGTLMTIENLNSWQSLWPDN